MIQFNKYKDLIAQISSETKWSTDVFLLCPSNKSNDRNNEILGQKGKHLGNNTKEIKKSPHFLTEVFFCNTNRILTSLTEHMALVAGL